MAEEKPGPETVLDASNRTMWSTRTYDFLSKNVRDGLVSLDLSTNHINPSSAKLLSSFLRSSRTIQFLSLCQTHLIEKSSVIIFSSVGDSTLLELYADDNIFTEKSCAALGDSLSKNPPLELLSLNGCDIPDVGVVAIVERLPGNDHLRHLRLESNSIFDVGASKIAEVLPQTVIESLCVADNQIWDQGTNEIIKSIKNSKLKCLDLSYNIVRLNALAEGIEHSSIKMLGLSGCKVDRDHVNAFLKKIPAFHLNTLIIDGFDFQMLPISWPAVKDTLWESDQYFHDFIISLKDSPELTDLRVGFFDLDKIFKITKSLEDRQNELVISIHDFGRTNDIWLLKVPGPHFESPTTVFRWNGNISLSNCFYIGQIILNTKVNTKDQIEVIDFHELGIEPDVFDYILSSLKTFPLKQLNCNANNLNDNSMETLYRYLNQIRLDLLDVRNNPNITDNGCFTFLKNLDQFPHKLFLCFKSDDLDEKSEHRVSEAVADIIRKNNHLHTFSLTGPITALDAINIVKSFRYNSHLREIELVSDHTEKYKSPDPELSKDIQDIFIDLVNEFHSSLCDESSKSKLLKFSFPYLSEIYLYSDQIYDKWIQIEDKLEFNIKNSRKKK